MIEYVIFYLFDGMVVAGFQGAYGGFQDFTHFLVRHLFIIA
jgi:hypothetical protein